MAVEGAPLVAVELSGSVVADPDNGGLSKVELAAAGPTDCETWAAKDYRQARTQFLPFCVSTSSGNIYSCSATFRSLPPSPSCHTAAAAEPQLKLYVRWGGGGESRIWLTLSQCMAER